MKYKILCFGEISYCHLPNLLHRISCINHFRPVDQNNFFANSIDPEVNEPFHQDLHCLPFCFDCFTDTPIWNPYLEPQFRPDL